MKRLIEKYHEFKITDLPTNEFCVLLETELQNKIIYDAAKKFGGWGSFTKLARHLKKRCRSFENVKWESINDAYIPLWKKCKMFIPIDVLIELFKFSGKNTEKFKTSSIRFLKYKSGRSKPINFNFRYGTPLAVMVEIIKTEGHLKTNFFHSSFSSENIEFIKYTKKYLKNLKIPNDSIDEILRVEIDAPKNVVRIIKSGNEIKFRKFVRRGKNKISFTDKFNYGEINEYKILTKKFSSTDLKVKILGNSKIQTQCAYGHSGAVIVLTIHNITFNKILYHLCNVPSGKKSKLIKLCPLIFTSPPSLKVSVIGAVIACEGWVELRGRRIRFFVESSEYVDGINKLLKDLGIKPNIDKNNFLSISSRNDLLVFSQNIDMIIESKKEKLNEILVTYKRFIFRWDEGLTQVVKILSKNNNLTAYQIARKINKHKDTAFFHINGGIMKGLITKNSQKMPFTYSITSKGENFLKFGE